MKRRAVCSARIRWWMSACTAFLLFWGSNASGMGAPRPAQSEANAPGGTQLEAAFAAARKLSKNEVRELKRQAESGEIKAQRMLGLAYDCGCGTRMNPAQAASWLRRAAEQNDAVAQCVLGLMYRKGRGVLRDNVEGMRWYRRAAEQNLPEAQNNLGYAYQQQGNFAEAERWYLKAVEGGYFFPLINLATLSYERENYPSTYFWSSLARQALCSGGRPCYSLLDRPEQDTLVKLLQAATWRLSAKDLREARQRASQWLEAHGQPLPEELAAARAPLPDPAQLPTSFGLYLIEGNLLKEAGATHPFLRALPQDFTVASLAEMSAAGSEDLRFLYDACYPLRAEPAFILFHEQVKPQRLSLEGSTPPDASLEVTRVENRPSLYRVAVRPPLRPNVYFLSAAPEGGGPLAGRTFLNCFAVNITFAEWKALLSAHKISTRRARRDLANAKTVAVVARGARSTLGESLFSGPIASTARAAKDVERQLQRWGRYALLGDPAQADLVFIITEWDEMDAVGIKRVMDKLEVVAGGPAWRENAQNPLWSRQGQQRMLQISVSAGFLVKALRSEVEKTEEQEAASGNP